VADVSRRAVRRELADLLPDAGDDATSLPVSNLLAGESLRLGEAEVCSSCGATLNALGGHRPTCANRGW
jgi:hypothetical protein